MKNATLSGHRRGRSHGLLAARRHGPSADSAFPRSRPLAQSAVIGTAVGLMAAGVLTATALLATAGFAGTPSAPTASAPASMPWSHPVPSPSSSAADSSSTAAPSSDIAPSSTVANTAAGVEPGTSCGAAVSYLTAHAAPGFEFVCPGYALGRIAMTCVDYKGVCPGQRLIVIKEPCPNAYMNEASNSWVLIHMSNAPIDPYGTCGDKL